MQTEINLPFITADASGPKHLVQTITRSKLEELVEPIVARCKKSIEQAMNDAHYTNDNIDKIIMVGGPTRMPIVQNFVESIVGPKIQRGIDPMECVSMGAAIQGAVLSGEVKDVLLLDVTPVTRYRDPRRSRNHSDREEHHHPDKKSQVFSTAADNQPSVEINVVQGERKMAADNTSLGKFILDGIMPARRGVPQIEVTFDIDANGIINVSAKDKGTGKEQKITIASSNKLSKDEIDDLVKQAEQYSEADKKKVENIEVRNQADTLVATTRKTMEELGEKATQEERTNVEDAVKDLEAVKDSDDTAAIKTKIDALMKVMGPMSERIYQQSGAQQQAGAEQAQQSAGAQQQQSSQGESKKTGGKDDGFVDADYKIVDDE